MKPWPRLALSIIFSAISGVVAASSVSLTQESAGGLTQAGDEFGASLTTGNFNGDAYADLVIGGPGEDDGAGAIFIFMGSAGGLDTGFFIKQSSMGQLNEAGDRFGAALAVGDFNSDGRDDLVVGAPGEDTDAGAIYYWQGSGAGLVPANGSVLNATSFGCGVKSAGDELGFALAAGNFNADTYDDLAIGAPGEAGDSGRVCIVKGRSGSGIAAGSAAYFGQSTSGPGAIEAGDRFGAALAAGRFSSGAHIDLAIGAPGEVYEDRQGGVVSVFFGTGNAATSASGFFTATGVLLTQELANGTTADSDEFGAAISAGNVTADTYADVIVGAPGNAADEGVFFVFPGSATGPANEDAASYFKQTSTLTNAGSEPNDEMGRALASGDLDGNGEPDLVVGAPGEAPGNDPANSGLIAEYYGAKGGLDVGTAYTQGDLQNGALSEAGDRFGAALALGDFNNDGRDELAVGAPGEAPGDSPAGGHVVVIGRDSFRLTHGPILGAVTSSSIKIWARSNRFCTFEVTRNFPPGNFSLGFDGGTLSSSNDYTGVVELTGLLPDTQYSYTVRLGGVEVYAGHFRTLPSTQTPGTIRFAYGADISVRHNFRPQVAFGEARAREPMFMILGGDNIYADGFPDATASTNNYRHRYRETFADPYLRSIMQEVPMFMTWDDHEISNNFYPGDVDLAPKYPWARKAFDEWQGSHNPDPVVAGELYYSFRAGQVDFFVLDTRSHRSRGSEVDSTGHSMLGATQLQALLDWLAGATGKFKFIVSSVPFNSYATTHADSWNGFTDERQVIFDYINSQAISGVVLLAGDQHWSGIYRLPEAAPYAMYEFMPSPIGINLRTPDRDVPPPLGAIVYESPDENTENDNIGDLGFGLFEIDTAAVPATLSYSWISRTGAVMATYDFTEDDIGL